MFGRKTPASDPPIQPLQVDENPRPAFPVFVPPTTEELQTIKQLKDSQYLARRKFEVQAWRQTTAAGLLFAHRIADPDASPSAIAEQALADADALLDLTKPLKDEYEVAARKADEKLLLSSSVSGFIGGRFR